MENMENNLQNQQAEQATQQQEKSQQGERLFTQEDVNRIVGERLARTKVHEPSFEERERSIKEREMKLTAREKLTEAGLPKDILGLVNYSDEDSMNESIAVIQKFFTGQAKEEAQGVYRVSTGISDGGSGSGSSDADIRMAMGLKKG